MKAKGIFISTLLVIDTFFVSYAIGFQSRHVLIINPKLPPVVQKKVEAKPIPPAVPAKKGDTKNAHTGKDAHASKTHGKGTHKVEVDKSKATGAHAGAAVGTSAKPTAKTSAPADSSKSKVSASDATKAAAKPSAKPSTKPAVKPAAKPASESKPKSTQDNRPGA